MFPKQHVQENGEEMWGSVAHSCPALYVPLASVPPLSQVESYGGAVSFFPSALDQSCAVLSGTLENNEALFGGALAFRAASISTLVLGGTFTSNKAKDGLNLDSLRGEGGAVFSGNSATPKLSASIFSLQHADAGGVLASSGSAESTFKSCEFYDNQAALWGGVAYLLQGSLLACESCTAKRNKAFKGGFARVKGARLTDLGSIYEANVAGESGGVFFLDTIVAFTVSYGTFNGNQASSGVGGGVVYDNGVPLPRYLPEGCVCGTTARVIASGRNAEGRMQGHSSGPCTAPSSA